MVCSLIKVLIAPMAWRSSAQAGILFAAFILTTSLLSTNLARCSPPEIQFIERFSSNQVLLHFDTDANRTYTLQYTSKPGTNGLGGSTWSNLYTAPLLSTPNHYIVPDWRTNKMRFYRLKVTP